MSALPCRDGLRRSCRVPALVVLLICAAATRAGERTESRPELVRLTLEPAEVVLTGAGARQQLLVTGHYADGSVRDLTAAASFASDRPDRVRLEGSVARASGNGEASITARAGGKQASARVTVG